MQQQGTAPPGGVWRQAVWRWAWPPRGDRGGERRGARRELALLAHSPQNINLLREMLRLDSLQRRLRPNSMPMTPPPQLGWHDQFLPGYEQHWRLPDMQIPLDRLPALLPAPPAPPPAPPHYRAWETAARGWGVAALLLAIILLLVRLSEKCLDTRLFKARRRRSLEWPTPNVLATSHVHNENIDDMEGIDPYCTEHITADGISSDLPPPYSECSTADGGSGSHKPLFDEPPPPYSACYVAFTNPKDGPPSIRFFGTGFENPRQDDSGQFVDTGQSSGSITMDVGDNGQRCKHQNDEANAGLGVGSDVATVGDNDEATSTGGVRREENEVNVVIVRSRNGDGGFEDQEEESQSVEVRDAHSNRSVERCERIDIYSV